MDLKTVDYTAKSEIVAFFDVDGTLLDSTIVHYYFWLRTVSLPRFIKPLWLAGFLPKIIYYLILDRISRTQFNKTFYRNYRDMNAEDVKGLCTEMFEDYLRSKIFPAAIKQIQEHKKQGVAVVLVTGSLDFIIQPVAEYLSVDCVLAPQLREKAGLFTGELTTPPLIGEEKAKAIQAFAAAHRITLEHCYGYSDSQSDLPMLECIGNPAVVNPGKSLREKALDAGWKMYEWIV